MVWFNHSFCCSMELIAELVVAIGAFVLEVTIHALVFVFILVMSVFSSRYRAKLKQEWDTSNSQRFAMVLGATLYSVALVFALFFWVPMLVSGKPADVDGKERQSGSASELVDVASELLKRGMDERKEKTEGARAESKGDGGVVEER